MSLVLIRRHKQHIFLGATTLVPEIFTGHVTKICLRHGTSDDQSNGLTGKELTAAIILGTVGHGGSGVKKYLTETINRTIINVIPRYNYLVRICKRMLNLFLKETGGSVVCCVYLVAWCEIEKRIRIILSEMDFDLDQYVTKEILKEEGWHFGGIKPELGKARFDARKESTPLEILYDVIKREAADKGSFEIGGFIGSEFERAGFIHEYLKIYDPPSVSTCFRERFVGGNLEPFLTHPLLQLGCSWPVREECSLCTGNNPLPIIEIDTTAS